MAEKWQLRDLQVTSLGMEARRGPTFGVDLSGQQGEVSRCSSYKLLGHILEQAGLFGTGREGVYL